jgi:hypothetical protein
VASPEPAVGVSTPARTCPRRLWRHFVIGHADPGQNPPAVRFGSSRVRGTDLGRAGRGLLAAEGLTAVASTRAPHGPERACGISVDGTQSSCPAHWRHCRSRRMPMLGCSRRCSSVSPQAASGATVPPASHNHTPGACAVPPSERAIGCAAAGSCANASVRIEVTVSMSAGGVRRAGNQPSS